MKSIIAWFIAVLLLSGLAACSKQAPVAAESHDHDHDHKHQHEHHAPHGGTVVVLGKEAYHLELVRDAATGTLTAYVLDGEMEKFIRIPAPTIEITATVAGSARSLVLSAAASAMTGETAGDTSQFTAQAEWLKDTAAFSAVIPALEIRGEKFTAVAFKFPEGNDTD